MVSYNFADVKSDDLDGGVLYVKAVYTPGENLNGGSSGAYYKAFEPAQIKVSGSVVSGSTNFSILFKYKRINEDDYGVTRIREPMINMGLTQVGATGSTSIGVLLSNGETLDVELTPSEKVSSVNYQLRETYGYNVITGTERSGKDALGVFKLTGENGFMFKGLSRNLLEMAYNINHGTMTVTSSTNWATPALLKAIPLYRTTAGAAYTNATFAKKAQTPLLNLVREVCAVNGDVVPTDLTWYQLQYAVLRKSAPYYVDAATAKAYCDTYPKLVPN